MFANGVLDQLGLKTGYGKAIIGILVAFLGALTTITTVGDQNLGDLTAHDWAYAAGAALSSGALIWLVSNIPGVAGGIAKSLAAAASAGIASFLLATSEGSAGGTAVTQAEWLGIISVAIVATGFVYQEKGPDG